MKAYPTYAADIKKSNSFYRALIHGIHEFHKRIRSNYGNGGEIPLWINISESTRDFIYPDLYENVTFFHYFNPDNDNPETNWQHPKLDFAFTNIVKYKERPENPTEYEQLLLDIIEK